MKELIRAIKFGLFSISAGLIQIITFTLLNELAHLPYWFSYLVALVLSVVWNFTLNRKYTFKSAANVPIAMLKVAAYYAVFTPLSTLLEHYLTTSLGWNEYLVTAINMLINFVTEFLYQRFFVFGKSLDTQVSPKEAAAPSADVLSEADAQLAAATTPEAAATPEADARLAAAGNDAEIKEESKAKS